MTTIIKRDGETVAELEDGESVQRWFIRNTPQSMDYALKHGGYSIEEGEDPYKGERSERGRYVTEQVRLWIVNDSDHYHQAQDAARKGAKELEVLLRGILRHPVAQSAPWQVSRELAPNDYNRIHWDEVAEELKGE